MNGRKKRVIDGAKSILSTRGFDVTSEVENEEHTDILGKDSGGKTIIVRIPSKEVVGVSELREYREEVEEKGYDHALFLALNKYGESGGYSVYAGFNYAVQTQSQNELIDAKFDREW